MWQDKHSGRRRHKLMTKAAAKNIPPLYTHADAEDPDSVVAHVKLFSIYSDWTWYITEWDPETGRAFGLVDGFEVEEGYFDLTELSETMLMGGRLPAIERDMYWKPQTLKDIKASIHA